MADSSLDIKMQDLKLSDSPVPALIPDRTPAETYSSVFEATTPPLGPIAIGSPFRSPGGTIGEEAEAEVEELLEYDTSSLKSVDIKTDPILASLARKQSSASRAGGRMDQTRPASVVLKARPAPSSTRQDGLGPRMTKSAALRQGLDWAVNSPAKRVEVGEHRENVCHVPGQKRETPQAPVASLAAPSIAPRSTKSSTLRSGTGVTGSSSSPGLPPKKDYAAQAIVNKVREKEERDRRRKSVALPASLSAPSIAPRQNKSSSLRTGEPVLAASRTLTTSSIENVGPAKVEAMAPKAGFSRRASIGVKSLGTPSITPRLNRAALLRAPGSGLATSITTPSAPPTPKTLPSVPRTPLSRTMSTNKPPTARPVSVISPRPTKASLLRAGLGAQVLSKVV